MTPRGVTAASVVVLSPHALERRSLVDGYGAAAVLILRLGVFYRRAHRREVAQLPGLQRRLGLWGTAAELRGAVEELCLLLVVNERADLRAAGLDVVLGALAVEYNCVLLDVRDRAG